MTAQTDAQQLAIATQDSRGNEIALPPAARGLRPKQIMFARLVASNAFSQHQCAELAGYGPYKSDASARAHASELCSDPRIAELIRVFTAALLKSSSAQALGTMQTVMQDPKAKDADKIKAAKAVLDKSIPTTTRHETQGHLEVEHHLPAGPTMEGIFQRIGKGPVPPHLAGPEAEPIDAEFTDVTDENDTVSDLAAASDDTPDDPETWSA